MSKVFLVVRAVVSDAASRGAFDRWYQTEHLPDAMKAFGARRGMRCWSRTDPAVHVAYYEFPSLEAATRVQESAALKDLVAAFDQAFPGVTRSREIIEVVQESGSAAV
ncbi:MAG: hypothetical protein J2P47_02775 [Acetobacteraceae bacterium]|nr:hypothetical protein [Acetobacteraceae bacterium]